MENARGDGRAASVRGVLVALHLLAVSMLGLPEPQVDPDDLKSPAVQLWFDRTTRQLTSLGLDVSREQVVEQSVYWGRVWLDVERTALAPARAYASVTGTWQSWRMFGEVPQESAVLFIEAKVKNRWVKIHSVRFGDATWRPLFWDQERTRSFVNQFTHKKARSGYDRLAKYLAAPLAEDFPEATMFRMGLQVIKFPDPAELRETGDVVWGDRYWVTQIPIPGAAAPTPASVKPSATPPAAPVEPEAAGSSEGE